MVLTYRKPKSLRVLTQVINYNSSGYATGILFGELPIGAMPRNIEVDVLTAFDISSSNRPWMGFSFNTAEWITTSEMTLDVASLGQTYRAFLNTGLVTPLPLAAARNVYFTGFGTPTVGKAIIRFYFEY